MPADLDVLRLQVAGVDHVLGAHERHRAVHHDQFAVVPQIRAAPLALERFDRHHLVPLDAGRGELGVQLLEPWVAAGGDVVIEQPHLHPTLDRLRQRGTENVGGVIPGGDEELHMHRRHSLIDRLGHRLDGGVVVAEQAMADTGDTRQLRQSPVQPEQAVHPDRNIGPRRQVRNPGGPFGDDLVRLSLNLRPPTPHKRAADQKENH